MRAEIAITIFADASHCPKTKAAGWGAWMKGGGRSGHTTGGEIVAPCPQPSDAEAWALAMAVAHAYYQGWLSDPAPIMLQSDCLRILQVLLTHFPQAWESKHPEAARFGRLGAKSRLTEAEQAAIETIRFCLSATNPRILLRHVRGHQSGNGRHWVNQACDQLARAHMKVRRAALAQPVGEPA